MNSAQTQYICQQVYVTTVHVVVQFIWMRNHARLPRISLKKMCKNEERQQAYRTGKRVVKCPQPNGPQRVPGRREQKVSTKDRSREHGVLFVTHAASHIIKAKISDSKTTEQPSKISHKIGPFSYLTQEQTNKQAATKCQMGPRALGKK